MLYVVYSSSYFVLSQSTVIDCRFKQIYSPPEQEQCVYQERVTAKAVSETTASLQRSGPVESESTAGDYDVRRSVVVESGFTAELDH